ncbi:MAG TPA: TRAP transporter substrate-binding protein DctP [Vicinamibacterales bacterium]|nr:TRAP transporter substrate-binding protein DctP [Vicinamibacterales bacterium]
MNRRLLLVPLLVAGAVASVPAQQQRVIRIASLAPARSVWDNALQQMRSDWARATEGRVRGTVYPSGQQGDENTVLLKLQSGTIEAAAFTLNGLARIDPAFNVFSIPLFFQSYPELNHVLARLTPSLRERVEKRGYALLHWGHAGWVRFFSTKPVKTLDDLKALKMWTTAGDDEMIAIYQRHGYRPIGLPTTAILTGLTSGMIEAVPTTPTVMLFSQWYGRARYMLDVPVTPFIGATVISLRAWRAIDENDRAAILQAAKTVEARLEREIPKHDDESVQVMRRKGLIVTTTSGDGWSAEGQRFADAMKGLVPDDFYAAALRERDAFRRQGAAFTR